MIWCLHDWHSCLGQFNLVSIYYILHIWLTCMFWSIPIMGQLNGFNLRSLQIYFPYVWLSCLSQFNFGSLHDMLPMWLIFMFGSIQFQFGFTSWYTSQVIGYHVWVNSIWVQVIIFFLYVWLSCLRQLKLESVGKNSNNVATSIRIET